MTIEEKAIYIAYFWKYATVEQIADMMILSIDIMPDYILEIGKEYYFENKLNMKNKLLNSKITNLNILPR